MKSAFAPLSRYDLEQSYDWNFKQAPEVVPTVTIPSIPGNWTYCGLPVNSPIGMAAGPLLNGKWLRYYAALGIDTLTYKTVRTTPRPCYDLPNLVPVETDMLLGEERNVTTTAAWNGSWAVSFGMPSKAPDFWIEDARQTKSQLDSGQRLSISVVGTMQSGWSIQELAADYAECARLAFTAQADCVEMNFSCPNVCSEDGQLFQTPPDAASVAQCARLAVGEGSPLLVKIGLIRDNTLLEDLLIALNPHVDAIVTTNSVPATIVDAQRQSLFAGQQRGICGRATRQASLDQVHRCREIIETQSLALEVIGVGGIESADDVREYLNAGANSIQIATAAMIDPMIGVRIKQEFE